MDTQNKMTPFQFASAAYFLLQGMAAALSLLADIHNLTSPPPIEEGIE